VRGSVQRFRRAIGALELLAGVARASRESNGLSFRKRQALVACSHVSGLSVRLRMTAGLDGFRGSRPYQLVGIGMLNMREMRWSHAITVAILVVPQF
jgi:hypothetical protein